jgi:hypothetical protein
MLGLTWKQIAGVMLFASGATLTIVYVLVNTDTPINPRARVAPTAPAVTS